MIWKNGNYYSALMKWKVLDGKQSTRFAELGFCQKKHFLVAQKTGKRLG